MGVALEAVTVQPQPNARPRQVRISRNVKVAVEAMVDGALTREEAAKHAGITDHALYCALRLPQVLAYRNERLRVIRTSEGARSIRRMAKLADEAESEHVKADVNKWLAATDPETPTAPTQRSESTINHKGLGPGLTIIMSQPEPVLVIDSQAHEVEIPNEYRHLPEPVPHPTSRNAQILRGISSSPAKGRGGK